VTIIVHNWFLLPLNKVHKYRLQYQSKTYF